MRSATVPAPADVVGTHADRGPATDGWVRAERAFRAMGSDAHVFVWQRRDDDRPGHELLDLAQDRIARCERRWSRFLPSSDVSRINRGAGTPVAAAAETLALLTFCTEAMAMTGGRFDPLLLPELVAAGYDRSFELLVPPLERGPAHVAAGAAADDRRHRTAPQQAAAARRPDGFVVDEASCTVTIPPGSALDLGGVGKGWTADLVADELVQLGVLAACVNIGGDLSTRGVVPEPDGLLVGVEDPFGGPDLALLQVHGAGVATTARTRRRWRTPAGAMHHVIDPTTGRPATTHTAAVTVVAPTGALAEVLATAVFLAGADDPAPLLDDLGAGALVVDDEGATRTIGTIPELP